MPEPRVAASLSKTKLKKHRWWAQRHSISLTWIFQVVAPSHRLSRLMMSYLLTHWSYKMHLKGQHLAYWPRDIIVLNHKSAMQASLKRIQSSTRKATRQRSCEVSLHRFVLKVTGTCQVCRVAQKLRLCNESMQVKASSDLTQPSTQTFKFKSQKEPSSLRLASVTKLKRNRQILSLREIVACLAERRSTLKTTYTSRHRIRSKGWVTLMPSYTHKRPKKSSWE